MDGVNVSHGVAPSEILDCGNGVSLERHAGGKVYTLAVRGEEYDFERGAIEQLGRVIEELTIKFPNRD
jgi:hypothetical protein